MGNFENIIGYDHIKAELERLIDCINNKEKYEKLGVKIPKNLLLYGDPGLGKTLFAKSFINALNRKQYIIRKNKPDGEFVNDINKTITEAMENAPSVVLLDDIDKFSNNDDDHKNSDEFVVVQTFIDDCKDKDVFFIATANDLRDMPQSLLRAGRFSNQIEFESPTVSDAAIIIKHYLSDKKVAEDVDCEEIARILDGRSCAVLESIMNEAGLFAGYNNRELITMDDIIKALLRLIYEAPEQMDAKTPLQLETAAYHEAGHALVSELLEPDSVNLVTVANYFGHKGGVTSQTMNKDYWCDFTKMENRVLVLLAGKAATDIMFNRVDIGCGSDLGRATRIVDRFYEDYGVCDLHYTYHESGNAVRDNKDSWIHQRLVDYYNKSKELIHNNLDSLKRIAEKLKEDKTIVRSELKKILY
jgi:cell division protease FtsH